MRVSIVFAAALYFFGIAAFAGAKEHFVNGQEYYEQGRYKEAVEEFQKAYDLDARPLLLYNIAQAYEKLGDLPNAVDYLKLFLKNDTEETETKTIQNRIANLEARIAKTGISVECSESSAVIQVDGNKLGETPAPAVIPLSEGMHEVIIKKPGFEEFKMNVGVSVGYAVPVYAKLEPGKEDTAVPSPSPQPSDNALPKQEESKPIPAATGPTNMANDSSNKDAAVPKQTSTSNSRKDSLRIVPWTIAGVGAAGAIVGFGVFGIMAMSQEDTTKAHIADGLGFGGAAVFVGGLTWGIVRLVKHKKEKSRTSAYALPYVDRQAAGLFAACKF